MAEQSSDGQEKTEEPTPKRLEKAKEDGQVASSKELFVLTTLLVGFLLYFGLLPFFSSILLEWSALLNFSGEKGLADEIERGIGSAFSFIFWKSLIFALPLLIVIALTQMAMSGNINWSSSAMAFKPSRINPLTGLKRMFSVKAFVEMLKAIFKIIALIGSAIFVFSIEVDKLITAQSTHLFGGVARLGDVFVFLLIVFLLVLAVIAVFDVVWQHYQHITQLKMTLQEIKDESKQTEGSPEVKARIRRLQMTAGVRAKQRREALAQIPKATAIITNPIHFAVALRYEIGSNGAPTILAMGRGYQAEEIIRIGKEAGVTVFSNELLARALFFAGKIGEEIPQPLYTAVAAVLAFIYQLNRGEQAETPDVELPEEMLFDATGKSLK